MPCSNNNQMELLATGNDTNPTVNVTVEYLRWQSVFRPVFGLAVGLHVRFFVLFSGFGDVHQIVRYALAVQYHGDPLLAFLHLEKKPKKKKLINTIKYTTIKMGT